MPTDPRRQTGRSPLLQMLLGYLSGDIAPNVEAPMPVKDNFIGPLTYSEQATGLMNPGTVGKIDAKKPVKAGNILAKPEANRLNTQFALSNLSADQNVTRQLDADRLRIPIDVERTKQTGAVTNQLTLQLAQDTAKWEQEFKKQGFADNLAMELARDAALKEQELKFKLKEIEQTALPKAKATGLNKIALDGFDPSRAEEIYGVTGTPKIEAAGLAARTEMSDNQRKLAESERQNKQFTKNEPLISGTEDIGVRTKFKEAQRGEEILPKLYANQDFDLKNYQKYEAARQARNLIYPTDNYSNIATGGKVLSKEPAAMERLLQQQTSGDPSSAGGYTAPTVQTKPEQVKPAPSEFKPPANPFAGLSPKGTLPMNELFGTLGSRVGFPRNTIGASTVNESDDSYGNRFREYVSTHPELEGQFNETMPGAIEDIIRQILLKYKK
jgi:hypothetical protein